MLPVGLLTLAVTLAVGQTAPEPAPPADPAPEAEVATPEPDTPEQAAPDPCVGRRVVQMALEGCAGLPCGEPEVRKRLFSLTDFQTKEPLDAARRDRALERLLATGFFETVRLRCVPLLRGGQKVTLVTKPNHLVRDVDVEGNQYFRDDELAKFIFLRRGSILNVVPGKEKENEDVKRLIGTLQNAYRREGLEDVEIDVDAEPTSGGAFDLTITITERARERLRKVDIRHVREIEAPDGVDDCPALSGSRLAELTDLAVGDVVTRRHVERATKNLRTFLKSIGYVQPKVQVKTLQDPLRLDVEVRTRQCWLLRMWDRDARSASAARSKPAFRFRDTLGLTIEELLEESDYDRVDFEDWREVLPFVESGVFHYEEALRGVQKIDAVLQSKGYLFAEVSLEHRRTQRPEDGTQRPVAGTIDYVMTLNYVRRLQGITFTGLRSFLKEELLEQMDTTVYDFFDVGGVVRVDQLLFDLTKIQRHYKSRGFYDFRYDLQSAEADAAPRRTLYEEGEWLVWEYRYRDRGFRVKKRKSEMVVYVEVPFTEGPRSRIDNVAVVGTAKLPAEEAVKLIGLVGGGRYGNHFLEQGLRKLRRWYGQRGYHRARVNVTCEAFDPEPPDGFCDPTNVRSRRIDLVVSVQEGERSVVGEVFVRGNFTSEASILVRDLPEPGEPYDDEAVKRAVREMRNLGTFNAVSVERIGIDEDPPRDRVALVVVVEEAQTRFLDIVAGIRTIDRDVDKDSKAPPIVGSIAGHAVATIDRPTTGLGRSFPLSLPDIMLLAGIEYLDLNLRGLGHQWRLSAEYGLSSLDWVRLARLRSSFQIPRVFDSAIRLEIDLVAEVNHVDDQLDRTEATVSTTVVWPVLDRMSILFGLDVSGLCFEDPSLARLCFDNLASFFRGDAMVSQEGVADDLKGVWTPQVRPSFSWRWDTQDNPLNPTSGFVVSTSLKYILGLDQNALEEESDLDAQQFVKWELATEFAYQAPVGLIIAGLLRYGGAVRLGGSGVAELLPFNERFTLGGTSGVRGFGDHEIGRYDPSGVLLSDVLDVSDDGGGNVMVNGSLEARIPIFKGLGIWGAGFLDMGGLAARHEDLHPRSLRWSAGLGVRWLIGNQIPVRLDWAFSLDGTRCVQWGSQENFDAKSCPRSEDGNRFHFELLYPF